MGGERQLGHGPVFFPSVSRFLVSDFSFLISCLCSMYVPGLPSEKVGEATSSRSGTQFVLIRKGPPASLAARPCWVRVDSIFFLVVALF